MQWPSLLLLGLCLLCCIQSVHLCCRRRRRRNPPPPPPPNKEPQFGSRCYDDIRVSAPRGKTGAIVSWSAHKWKATDPDSPNPPSVTLITANPSGSYFSGKVPWGTTVIYKARDSRNGVAYCSFRVHVIVKYCSAVPWLQYGRPRQCTGEQSNVYGSKCTSVCHTGYRINGADKVECRSNQQWSAAFPTCQPVSCGDPGIIENGQVQCPNGHVYPGICIISCARGFQYEGIWRYIRCMENGAWQNLYACRDVQAPTFPDGCPEGQTIKSGPLGSAVAVTWSYPLTSDNSGESVTLISDPAHGAHLKPGSHTVTITATDSSGNSKDCSFQVDIELWTCPAIQIVHGRVSCTNGYMVGSECSVACIEGHELEGSATLTCVSTEEGEEWSPSGTSCEIVQCPEPQLNRGMYFCPNGQTYTELCFPICDRGFDYKGPDSLEYIQCSADGSWARLGHCLDVAPPDFPHGCPPKVDAYAAALGQASEVRWNVPEVTDNSGNVSLSSDHQPGSEFPIGVTTVTYTATDPTGNTQYCTFTVTLTTLVCTKPNLEEGKTQPAMTYDCPNGFVYGASCALHCSYGYPLVGSGNITCARNDQTYPPTMFWDWPGPSTNPPECNETECPDLQAPGNGALTCHRANFGWDCLMSCQDPYDVPGNVGEGHFYCTNSNGYWIPSTVPNCTMFQRPGQAKVMSDLFYYSDSCNVSTEELRQNFITRMKNSNILSDACSNVPPCTLENVEVHCGSFRRKRDEDGDRKRRDIEDKHRIFRRQSGASSHYILITYEWSMNSSANASRSVQETFQMCEEAGQKFYTNLLGAVQNGTFDVDNLVLDPTQAVGYPVLSAVCSEGTVARKHNDRFSCVGCSKGYYLLEGGSCEECPVGTYSDIDNAVYCTPCPEGLSTVATATKASSQCIDQCPKGYKSPNGFIPCQPCPAGRYQPDMRAESCDPCPVNTWTHNVGASTEQSCVAADIELSNSCISSDISSNWSSVTVSLRVGFPDRDSTVTVSIKSSVTGSVLASHVLSALEKVDEVRESKQRLFHHFTIVVTSSDAAQLPDNDAVLTLSQPPPDSTTLTVHSEQSKVLISSLAVFGEILTTEDINSLASSCTVNIADNLLTWLPAPSAVLVPSVCDAVDECSATPCGDHGVCVNQLPGYQCQCQGRWSGSSCEVPPNPCANHQCQNGAACVPVADNYTCTCPSQYAGVFCQQEKVHGDWTEWLPWTPCTCGTQQLRRRLCTNPTPQNGGNNCSGNNTEVNDCPSNICHFDEGEWSGWDDWSNCSASCDGGQTTRQRTCQHGSGSGQALCEGSTYDYEEQACNAHPCPVHGGWSDWSAWSPCSVTCGDGVQTRERTCINPVPAYGGISCNGSDTDSQACGTDTCPECTQLHRPPGSIWYCEESQSPYFVSCKLTCLPPYVEVNPTSPSYCGHNTSFEWNHQLDRQTSSPEPTCSRSHPLTGNKTVYTVTIKMKADCDPTKADEVNHAVRDNINSNVPCRQQSTCNMTMSTGCTISRKRSTPSFQISLTATPDLNITDFEYNETVTTYLELMSSLNQSVPDNDTLQFLFTVTLPGGQTVTPDMTSVVSDLVTTCDAGMVLRDFFCAECPVGTMEENGMCVQCPLGFYQDQPAATSCKPCPSGFSWDLPGATSILQCVFPMEVSTSVPSSTTDRDHGEEPVNIGLVVGLVVAVVAIIIAVVAVCMCKHMRK